MKYRYQRSFETLSDLVKYDNLKDAHVDGMDSRDPHQSWLKDQFRKSEEWRWFCRSLIEKRGGVCERCGGTGSDCSGLQVHHIHPEDYTDLTESHFAVLCGRCHLQIEGMSQTEETMKMAPKKDRRFLTARPYRDGQVDVLRTQSGLRTAKKWVKAVDVEKNPERYVNPQNAPKVNREEARDAISFMKDHPELFR
jgi:hypothetical protein